ncbi:MAG: hypothetical protein OSB09_10960, partial [Planctomycetota bacterium]|nr:hypothetical protein [Planctomycetota bacterium]
MPSCFQRQPFQRQPFQRQPFQRPSFQRPSFQRLCAVSLLATMLCWSSLASAADAPFRRGDPNNDGAVDISDPIVIL